MDGWMAQDNLFIGYIHFGWTNHVEHPIYIPHDENNGQELDHSIVCYYWIIHSKIHPSIHPF
jgi:hypothetical protein